MSISTLQSQPRGQVQRSSTSAESKEASFLTFNYVNKHARVRVSPTPLDLSSFEGKGDFLAVANNTGWFAAITRSEDGKIQLSCSSLSHLHTAFAINPAAGVDEIDFTPQRILTISPATPNILTLAYNETRLLIGSTQGPIAVYDCSQLFTAGTNDINPIYTFSGSQPCEQIVPNPGDIPELVAVLRQGDGSVELLNVSNGQSAGGWKSGGTPDTTASSVTWSPRGKQLAIGLQSGDIVTFSPSSTDSPKSFILKPPGATDNRIIGTAWLANPTFHAIYAPPGPITPKSQQSHYIVNFDSKSNSASDVSLSSPYYPFPGLRPPGAFVLVLRNWDPVKYLLFIGDSTSSDIGTIGCFSDDKWYNLSLDEACTPSLPLDKNMDDMILLGLELDLTAKDPYNHTSASGEKVEVPAPPIVYAYCNDGTLLAWHVVNANASAYPGMVGAATSTSTTDAPMSMTPSASMSGTVEASTNQPVSAFGSAQPSTSAFGFGQAKQPAFGQSSFGQSALSPPSAFGSSAPSGSGFSAFAKPGAQPAFGQTSFGQSPTSPPAFGQSSASPSAFGQPTTSPPAFGQSAANASAFGKPSFVQPAFGQSSLGQSAFGQSSFGQTSQPSAFGSGFGNSAFTKPPTSSAFGSSVSSSGGFASYASANPSGFGQSNSAFSATSPPTTQPPPETKAPELTRDISMGAEAHEATFGGLSLGGSSDTSTDREPTPGKGTAGLFGQATSNPTPAFGSSSFGSSATTNSGFGAFSNWSQSKPESSDLKPATPINETLKPSPAAAFGQSGFGAKPAFGQSSFGQPPAFGKPSLAPAVSTSSTPSAFGSSSGGFGAYAKSSASFAPLSSAGLPAKPVWATAKDETPPSKQPPKPVFALEQSSTSEKAPETPQKSPSTTPPATEFKPSVFGSVAESPASKSAEPVTPFKSSSPATPGGVFGNLKQSPVGFGSSTSVFGQPDTSSPFFKAAQKPDTSVFGSAVSTTPMTTPKAAQGGSVFGSPSPLGSTSVFGKTSVFGNPSTPTSGAQASSTPINTPTSGGFSAFSGSSSPFGKSTSGSGSSFSDLLKGEKKAEDVKPPISVFSLPTSKDKEEGEFSSSSPTKVKQEEDEEPPKVFSAFLKTPPQPKKGLPSQTPPDTPGDSEDGGRSYSEDDEISFKASSEEEEGDHGEGNFESDTGSESFLDESLSYEEISAQLADEQDLTGPHELSPVQEETSLLDESGDENETSVQETLINDESPDPTKIPLPFSRSPSATPGDLNVPALDARPRSKSPTQIPLPDTPSDSAPGSPSATPRVKPTQLPSISPLEVSSLPKADEPSTTPPSSPAKLSPAMPIPSPTSPFGIGLGRPSAKPARSSPLAGAPILGENATEDSALSSSSSSFLKPRPASPKVAFGQWGSSSISDADSFESRKRPKTPPLTALGPPPAVKPFSLPPASAAPTPPSLFSSPSSTSFFGQKPNIPTTSPAAPPPLFGSKPATPAASSLPFGFDSPSSSQTPPGPPAAVEFFGAKPSTPSTPAPSSFAPKTPAAPAPFSAPQTPPTTSYFGQKAPSTTPPSGSLFGQKPPQTPSPSLSPNANAVKPPMPTPPIPEPSVQEGMQAECAYLFNSMNKELDDFKMMAQAVSRKREFLIKAKPVTGTKADLGDPSKWSMADIPAYGKIMKQLQEDNHSLRDIRDGFLKTVQEIESDMLKATTRKEEIVRFSKATSTAEFTKMMKLRTLGPEHLETQTKLRKQMRNIRDRVEKLEGHLQSSKKLLSRQKSGKVGFKAPTLDTVNRTYRNIDIAIAQQADDVAKLTSRMAKLDMKSLGKSSSSRDKRLPEKATRRLSVTPSVAATTAAALNAERSAYKLKQVLLSVRQKPLLNDKAAHAPPSRVDFKTPLKSGGGWGNSNWQITPTGLGSPSSSPSAESPLSVAGSRRGAGSKHHQKSVTLKRAAAEGSPTPAPAAPAGFSWGPLPALVTKPPPSLPFSIR